MRRIQIYLDEPLDDLLSARAATERRSKAALIREAVADYYGESDRRLEGEADALDAWIGGTIDEQPMDIDSVVYDLNEQP